MEVKGQSKYLYKKVVIFSSIALLVLLSLSTLISAVIKSYEERYKENEQYIRISNAIIEAHGEMHHIDALHYRYLISNDESITAHVKSSINSVNNIIQPITDIAKQIDTKISVETLLTSIDKYYVHFSDIQDLVNELGVDENHGLHGALRNSIHHVERILDNNNTQLTPLLSLRIQKSMLMLRRHEKDFIQRVNEKYIHKFNKETNVILDLIMKSPDEIKNTSIQAIYNYRDNFRIFSEKTLNLMSQREILKSELNRTLFLTDQLAESIKEIKKRREDQSSQLISDFSEYLWISIIVMFVVSAYMIFLFRQSAVYALYLHQLRDKALNEKRLAETTLSSIGDGVIIIDNDGHLRDINNAAIDITRIDLEKDRGKNVRELLSLINDETMERVDNPLFEAIQSKKTVFLEDNVSIHHADGTKTHVSDSASPILDNNGDPQGAIMVIRDVTEQRMYIKQIHHQATHDSLTGLANRIAFEDSLNESLISVKANGHTDVLIVIDLDRFKVVNDTCGHQAGDLLLKNVTNIIRKHVKGSDSLALFENNNDLTINSDNVARLGGDEFSVILYSCPMDAAFRIAQSIGEDIKAYNFLWEGTMNKISASIGIAEIVPEYSSIKEIIKNADMACFAAKNMGRGCVFIHSNEDENIGRHHKEMQWVSILHDALNKDHFILRRQAIASVDNVSNINKYEVLIGLRHRDELLMPGAFLPAAERYQLMREIDCWVIHNTFKCMSIEDEGHIYSINLSSESLGEMDTIAYIMNLIELYHLNPTHLIFEITESEAIKHLETCNNIISSLRKTGCQIALDDFGTGYSSLSYIKNIEADYIKIDGVFIKNIVSNSSDKAIVRSIIQLASDLNLGVIAEFVESEEIIDELKALNIDYVQGWAIAKPEIWFDPAKDHSQNNLKNAILESESEKVARYKA